MITPLFKHESRVAGLSFTQPRSVIGSQPQGNFLLRRWPIAGGSQAWCWAQWSSHCSPPGWTQADSPLLGLVLGKPLGPCGWSDGGDTHLPLPSSPASDSTVAASECVFLQMCLWLSRGRVLAGPVLGAASRDVMCSVCFVCVWF